MAFGNGIIHKKQCHTVIGILTHMNQMTLESIVSHCGPKLIIGKYGFIYDYYINEL